MDALLAGSLYFQEEKTGKPIIQRQPLWRKEAALLIAQRFRDAMEVGRESLELAANGN
jgi:hypothetical protein